MITGASGFVGANLARRLLRDGHEVHLLQRPGYRGWRIDAIRADLVIHEVDLEDRQSLEPVIATIRPEWIFHLAAHGAYSWQQDVPRLVGTNLVGTISLVEASARIGFESFVYAGSSSEYGLKDHPPGESESPEPNSLYAVTKLSGTLYCRYVAQRERLRIRTLRLYSVYGPFEEPGRLVPTLIIRALGGALPTLAAPQTARDYVFTEDVSEAFVLAASRQGSEPGATYNIGTGRQTTLKEVVDLIRGLLEVKAEPVWGSMADRPWDTPSWVANNARAKTELGWRPRYDLARGLAETVRWFRTNDDIRQYYVDRRATTT